VLVAVSPKVSVAVAVADPEPAPLGGSRLGAGSWQESGGPEDGETQRLAQQGRPWLLEQDPGCRGLQLRGAWTNRPPSLSAGATATAAAAATTFALTALTGAVATKAAGAGGGGGSTGAAEGGGTGTGGTGHRQLLGEGREGERTQVVSATTQSCTLLSAGESRGILVRLTARS